MKFKINSNSIINNLLGYFFRLRPVVFVIIKVIVIIKCVVITKVVVIIKIVVITMKHKHI